MKNLIYISSATKNLDHHELGNLLKAARKNNERNGITGILIYKAGNVLQYLEGGANEVDITFNHISVDPRHHDIYKMYEGEIEDRIFKDWTMGFRDFDKEEPDFNMTKWEDEQLNILALKNNPSKCLRFIKMFMTENREI